MLTVHFVCQHYLQGSLQSRAWRLAQRGSPGVISVKALSPGRGVLWWGGGPASVVQCAAHPRAGEHARRPAPRLPHAARGRACSRAVDRGRAAAGAAAAEQWDVEPALLLVTRGARAQPRKLELTSGSVTCVHCVALGARGRLLRSALFLASMPMLALGRARATLHRAGSVRAWQGAMLNLLHTWSGAWEMSLAGCQAALNSSLRSYLG